MVFGYIRIAKPELKVKEYEAYKAVYCSLCRTMGRKYGFLTRFALSYDFTFLALLNISLNSGFLDTERKRCVCNPLKKCNYCKTEDYIKMPAAVAMIMLYYKLCDNTEDEKFFKSAAFRFVKLAFSGGHKKAAKEFPEVEDTVKRFIAEQTNLEKQNCAELDRAADPTAKAMSELLALCSKDAVQKRVLKRLGYCMGRYVYILDAACDIKDDIKNGSYNVFVNMKTDQADIKEITEPKLYFCINEAAKAFELLDIKNCGSILGNIIYLGLEDTFRKELSK